MSTGSVCNVGVVGIIRRDMDVYGISQSNIYVAVDYILYGTDVYL